MKLSVSSIAWNPDDDLEISNVLREFDVEEIDIAPTKYSSDLLSTDLEDWVGVRRFWRNRGISITGMQSLVFGRPDFNIFSSDGGSQEFISYLSKVARIAETLGVNNLVFGSPKNRIRGPLIQEDALEIAQTFFSSLSHQIASLGVTFCIEPNPKTYGCDFLNTHSEVFDFVRHLDRPNIKSQLDVGAIIENKENVMSFETRDLERVGHGHLSLPHLDPIDGNSVDLFLLANRLTSIGFDARSIAIEMLNVKGQSAVSQVRNAVSATIERLVFK